MALCSDVLARLGCNTTALAVKDDPKDGASGAPREWNPLEALFDDAPAGVAIVRGARHVHERCNDFYCSLLGRASNELVDRSVREALPELDALGVLSALDRVRASEEPVVLRALPFAHGETPDEERYFNWILKPARGGSEVDRIFVFVIEVTEQVRKRQRAEQLALAEATNRVEAELAQGRLQALTDLAFALSRTVTTDDVAEIVVDQGMRHARANIATLYALDEAGEGLDLLSQRGVAPEVLQRILRITTSAGNPAVLETLRTGQSVWAETEREYMQIFPEVARTEASGPRAKAFWSVPLEVEGRPVGLLGMGFHEEQRFSTADRRFVQTFAKLCAQALQRALLRDREFVARRWLSTTLQSIGDAVIATDTDGRITFMNSVAERLTGYTEAEASGKPLHEVFVIFSELTRETVESPVTKVLREGAVVGLANHTLLRAKNGAEIPIDDSGAPIRDAHGQIYGVVLVFRDVTAEKRAEKRRAFLARAMETLVSSLDYRVTLKRVAELAVPELADWVTVDILDPESDGVRQLAVAHVDPEKLAFAREVGERYPPNRGENSGPARVMRTNKSELYPELAPALIEGAARDAEHLRILRELRLESAMIVPLCSESGRMLGAMTFIYADSGRRYREDDLSFAEDFARRAVMAIENARAVSEVEAARVREREMREQAELANTAKDHFLATVSHELRTPLNVILGWSVVLREREAPAEFMRALGVIERNARAQARLIEDVLDVSRINSGKLSLSLGTVNVGEALRVAVEGMRPAASAKNIQLDLETELEARTMTIAADADRLQQIFWNLLANAVKFTPKDGTITVAAERVGSEVRVRVSDSGEGIRAGALPYVFEPFRQADSSTTRRHGGLGLGLSLVKQLAAAHGGTVEAHSDGEGLGATFIVRLPARAATQSVSRPSRPTAPDSAAAATQSGRLHGISVLVVDDEDDARELVVEAFRAAGA
ncbi:MAG TPA: ATP-binding protein, partial [Polyangiaceae bacterium]|nr:ATP-binding protein [Polyangiaceae bacterium]